MVARNDEHVGPVLPVIHDAAARRSPANIEPLFGRELFAHPCGFLPETEGKRLIPPPVMSETDRRRRRIALEKQEIDGHVLGGGAHARGQNVELHGSRLRRKGSFANAGSSRPQPSARIPHCIGPETGNCCRRRFPTRCRSFTNFIRGRIQFSLRSDSAPDWSIRSPGAGVSFRSRFFSILACRHNSRWVQTNSSRRLAAWPPPGSMPAAGWSLCATVGWGSFSPWSARCSAPLRCNTWPHQYWERSSPCCLHS